LTGCSDITLLIQMLKHHIIDRMLKHHIIDPDAQTSHY